MKKYALFLLLAGMIPTLMFGQNYLWPTDASHYLSSTFGEYRARHFHAGLDIKTWNTTGYKAIAIDDGYIWRIRTSYDGYGKVVYQKLPDGRITVYAHLDHFIEPIADLVDRLHNEQNRYTLDYFPQRDDFPVKKGQVLAYTGNTGTRYPHLHFEIRNSNNQPMNPLELGFTVKDHVAPSAQELAIAPLTTESTVNGSPLTQLVKLTYLGHNKYRSAPVTVSGNFGLEIRAYDGVSDVYNKYSVYSASVLIGDSLAFRFKYDWFKFSQDNLILLERDYGLDRQGDGRFQRLYTTKFTKNLPFYDTGNSGHLDLPLGDHTLVVQLEDYYGNQSTIRIPITVLVPRDLKPRWRKTSSDSLICTITETQRVALDGVVHFYAIDSTGNTRLLEPNTSLETRNQVSYNFAPQSGDQVYYAEVQNSAGEINKVVPYDLTPDRGEQYPLEWHFTNQGMIGQIIFGERRYGGYALEVLSTKTDTVISFLTDDFIYWSTQPVNPEILRGAAIFLINRSSGKSQAIPDQFAVASRSRNTIFKTSDKKAMLQFLPQTVYFPGLVWYDTLTAQNFTFSPIWQFYPRTMPFENTGTITINLPSVDFPKRQLGIYYSEDGVEWNYLPAEFSSDSTQLTGEILSLESFTLQRDSTPPVIVSRKPMDGSTFNASNLKRFEFRVLEAKSLVDPARSIQLLLDGTPVIFEFNPITKILVYRLRDPMQPGSHTVQVLATDAAGNSAEKTVTFTLR